jgi:hypothetical protein
MQGRTISATVMDLDDLSFGTVLVTVESEDAPDIAEIIKESIRQSLARTETDRFRVEHVRVIGTEASR